MEQITAFFENVDWDNVLGVVADYITQFDIKPAFDSLYTFFMNFVGVILGAFGISLL